MISPPSPGSTSIDSAEQPSSPAAGSRTLRLVVAVVLGLVGGWLGLILGGTVHHEVGPLTTSMRVLPTWGGGTRVVVPPLGELDLATHGGPLGIRATLEGFDVEEARALVARPELLADLKPRATADLRWELEMAALRSVLATVAGALALSALGSRRVRSTLVGGGTALVAVTSALAVGVASWNPAALAEPRYEGLLSSAPSVVGSAETIVTDFSRYGDQLAQIVRNVSGIYTATSTLPLLPASDDVIKVLHVSDLHLAPQSWDLIRTVATQYDVDVIVDSGDITDHGTAPENRYVEEIRHLDRPYVWVRGNHDSAVTERAMRRLRNVVVLEGKPRKVAGLTFLGAGDPTFTPDKAVPASAATVTQAAEKLTEKARENGDVDVLVFHDPADEQLFDGAAPTALFGHLHYRRVEHGPQGTWLMVQGSTGGSGLRALEPEEPAPILLSVLYVDRTTHQLRAYDDIRLGGLGNASAEIHRQVLDPPDGATTMVADKPRQKDPAATPAPASGE
ncbi:MAG: metallophosphoesterase family protein [Nocardioides sp.]